MGDTSRWASAGACEGEDNAEKGRAQKIHREGGERVPARQKMARSGQRRSRECAASDRKIPPFAKDAKGRPPSSYFDWCRKCRTYGAPRLSGSKSQR